MKTFISKLSSSPKHCAWAAVVLCVGCCAAIPLLGLLGLTAFIGVGIYIELAAIALIIASLSLFARHYWITRKKGACCELDCSCKDEKSKPG